MALKTADLEPSARATLLIHYYRAMVGRADIWRMRMDSTTNWAIGASAAVITFSLGNAAAPHTVVHVAAFLTLIFLFLEARRLTFYHLWQQRVLLLERGFLRPALAIGDDTPANVDYEEALAAQLGTTVPSMSLSKAIARRLRRIYVYLFAVQLAAWVLKLASHPVRVLDTDELIARAHVGDLPGGVVVAITGLAFFLALSLAVTRGGVSRANDRDEPA